MYLNINEGLFLHCELHYLKFVCKKKTCLNFDSIVLCLLINPVIIQAFCSFAFRVTLNLAKFVFPVENKDDN